MVGVVIPPFELSRDHRLRVVVGNYGRRSTGVVGNVQSESPDHRSSALGCHMGYTLALSLFSRPQLRDFRLAQSSIAFYGLGETD